MEKQQGLYPQVDTGYPPQQQGYAQPPGYQPVPQKPGDPGYGQSQGTVIVTQPAPVMHAAPQEPMPSPVGSIIFSCCVFWCCCWPLGCIAFIFAVLGATAKTRADALQKIGIANKISIAALVCGIIILIIVVVLQVTAGSQTKNDGY